MYLKVIKIHIYIDQNDTDIKIFIQFYNIIFQKNMKNDLKSPKRNCAHNYRRRMTSWVS